jgi:DNA-binding SARP family transcriptional activator
VETFEAKIQSARRRAASRDVEGALREYDEALALHRGVFLEDEDDAWVMGPRSHYEALHASALSEAARLHAAHGDPATAVALLEKRIGLDPADEEASVLLMKTLGARGERAAVEREFRRPEGALRAAASRGPGAEARRAYRAAVGDQPEERV